MLKTVLTITSLFLSLNSAVATPPPSELMRLVCFPLRVHGDISTIDYNFVIIITQSPGGPLDGSYFIPGQKNYKEPLLTEEVNFSVKVYKNAKSVSQATDHKVLAEELLQTPPQFSPTEQAIGGRALKTFAVGWGDSLIKYDGTNEDGNLYIVNEEDDMRDIRCEDPYGVPAPSNLSSTENIEDGSTISTEY